jgi:hypothetical protein
MAVFRPDLYRLVVFDVDRFLHETKCSTLVTIYADHAETSVCCRSRTNRFLGGVFQRSITSSSFSSLSTVLKRVQV